ncbi:class I SAM-dependent methyltransferase [Methanococcoides sp.]|uniref:class I SAM-dependent methyltransferase n=1 Tax=Methanococcoides sp. TaxID=1966350 RepID=UPI00272E7CC0|nr:class I SAM-dependent methyltransferase [Methanococcoides sp.]
MHSRREKKVWQEIFTGVFGKEKLKILDVGTGPGISAILLIELGHDVTGMDLSEVMLKNARENATRFDLPVDLIQGDAEKLPFEDGSFDAIFNRHVLWTLQNPEMAIAEWRRVLKSGGKIVIIDGNWDDYKRIIYKRIWQIFLASPLILITDQYWPTIWRRKRRNHTFNDIRLPMRDVKRPDTDIELLKTVGFINIEVNKKIRMQYSLLNHLKYGYQGNGFLISAIKGD